MGDARRKVVVCFGAGHVAGPCVEYLLREEKVSLVVAAAVPGEAEQLCTKYAHLIPPQRETTQEQQQELTARTVDVLDEAKDGHVVDELCSIADCVVALVPEPAQVRVAQACIKASTPLVTASYASPAIKQLHKAAKEANIPILCEMGLDPGMDHMIAMKMINEVKAKNGKVVSFSSVCGGLPAPDAANNPIKYKFSWSPVGALRAAQRPAQYLKNGETVTIPGSEILAHDELVKLFPEYELEQVPNGYSLPYAEYYQIPDAKSLFRGTLRFKGFCQVIHKCVQLGLLSEDSFVNEGDIWKEIIAQKLKLAGMDSLDGPTQVFLHWLGFGSPRCVVSKSQSTMEAFCELLVRKLSFEPGERDLVLMHVAVGVEYPDGSQATLESFFNAFGEANGDTIMAKTVGATAAIGVALVLSGKISFVGIVSPTQKEVYEPSLTLLAAEGIHFKSSRWMPK
uniref:Saccharopine dehydrogenase NADP binding domain-containing protein n=1 Tax=Globisporangium ultimum (strain ATCC 200006 / CBS 805.95 / DAOM BR144) TaxID=431595 RepID=K3WBC1_GLOUD